MPCFATSAILLLLISTAVVGFATVRHDKGSFLKSSQLQRTPRETEEAPDVVVDALRSKRSQFLLTRSVAKSSIVAAGGVGTVTNSGDFVAKILGYTMGAGSLMLYSPIILKLLNTKKADGFSHETWMFNLIGLTAAVIYPFKKGFPTSTYRATHSLRAKRWSSRSGLFIQRATWGICCWDGSLFDDCCSVAKT